jgi:hypothetical protein
VSDFSSQLYNRSCFYVNAKDIFTLFLSIYYNTPTWFVDGGGFSGCKILQDKIRSFFPNYHVIVPEDAELAVLKGAVLFGHKPDYIVARIARYTYGVSVMNDFNPAIHEPGHGSLERKILFCLEEFCSQKIHLLRRSFSNLILSSPLKKKTRQPISIYSENLKQ